MSSSQKSLGRIKSETILSHDQLISFFDAAGVIRSSGSIRLNPSICLKGDLEIDIVSFWESVNVYGGSIHDLQNASRSASSVSLAR